MSFFDLASTSEAYTAIKEALGEALGNLGHDIERMGGEIACTASIKARGSGRVLTIVQPQIIGAEPNNPDKGRFLLHLAMLQRLMSERLGISTRTILANGLGLDTESKHFGSAVFTLDAENDVLLIVGCAGPNERWCELYAELIGTNTKRALLILEQCTAQTVAVPAA